MDCAGWQGVERSGRERRRRGPRRVGAPTAGQHAARGTTTSVCAFNHGLEHSLTISQDRVRLGRPRPRYRRSSLPLHLLHPRHYPPLHPIRLHPLPLLSNPKPIRIDLLHPTTRFAPVNARHRVLDALQRRLHRAPRSRPPRPSFRRNERRRDRTRARIQDDGRAVPLPSHLVCRLDLVIRRSAARIFASALDVGD